MAVSFIGLIALAGLAAVVFLAVLGLITLLTNPKTRDLAKILLGGLAAVTLLLVLIGGLFVGVARHEAVATIENEHWNGPAPAAEVGEIELEREAEAPAEVTEPSADVALPPDPRGRESIDNAVDTEESTPAESVDEEAVTEEPVLVAEEAEVEEAVAEEAVAEEAEVVAKESAAPPEEPEDSDVTELSVAPLSVDPNRPSWVDREPYKEGSIYCWPVAADPRPDASEAEAEALPAALDGAVADYIKSKLKLGSLASRRVHLNSDYVRNELVGKDLYVEPVSLSMGEFVRVHALVKFDREANSIIRERWDKQRLVGRLWSAGGFLTVVLLFLSLIYCYLKIDQVTGGSRRALLRFAAILVILGLMLVAAGVASVGIA